MNIIVCIPFICMRFICAFPLNATRKHLRALNRGLQTHLHQRTIWKPQKSGRTKPNLERGYLPVTEYLEASSNNVDFMVGSESGSCRNRYRCDQQQQCRPPQSIDLPALSPRAPLSVPGEQRNLSKGALKGKNKLQRNRAKRKAARVHDEVNVCFCSSLL